MFIFYKIEYFQVLSSFIGKGIEFFFRSKIKKFAIKMYQSIIYQKISMQSSL